ncbi:uncharacterized protein ColSpa_10247 [Colletotrichum spaethianum]|uniref:Uncharacterized protein n=1 Tax=Colletotrichum spaethianum TaxID=700344 RepID=A0AA37PD69_9PEZI|nr:uncharacterized protein ColSpa_10247 [Colletotrichum spaethianum]GKT50066.1 hypothetical protein ColSpa_10247 [Colletotrichum spaethianum]
MAPVLPSRLQLLLVARRKEQHGSMEAWGQAALCFGHFRSVVALAKHCQALAFEMRPYPQIDEGSNSILSRAFDAIRVHRQKSY